MKRLAVQQHLNPAYLGDSTPDEPKHLYKVVQVIDCTTPAISTDLTQAEVDTYCESDDWTVTIK